VLLPFALTRLALVAVGMAASSRDWLGVWLGWDVGWYLKIARDGYSYTPGVQSSIAFAPGLPLLMRTGASLIGRTDDEAYITIGVVISNLALIVALVYLLKLARLDLDGPTARRAPLYLLVFPSTLFLSGVYPHSLFLAASMAAFYYARTDRWWLAGLVGAVAALTRLQGALLVVPLALEYLAMRGFAVRRVHADVLWLALVPAGLLAFVAYSAWRFGAPLAMFTAGSAWERQLAPPWDAFLPYLSLPWGAHGTPSSPLDLLFTLVFGGLVALCWTRLRPSLALFATLFLLVFLSSGSLISSMRYGLELFPIFMVLAISGRSPLFHYAYIVLAGLAALRLMTLYASGEWIA
jgi:hypothetical protein